jgi:hypothetical protein
MLSAVAITIMAAVPGKPAPVTLWQKVQQGMSREAVQAAYPNASMGTCGQLGETLILRHHSVGVHDMVVCFFFKNNGLESVNIRSEEEGGNLRTYDDMTGILRAQYGTPATESTCDEGLGSRLCKAAWQSGTVKISVTLR